VPVRETYPFDDSTGPTTLKPKDLKQLHFLLQRFRDLSSDERYTLVQLMTMSAADFLDQWFETDVLKATMSASGIIGTFLGIRRRVRRTYCSTTIWARLTGRSGRGDSAAVDGRYRMQLRRRRAKRAWKFARKPAFRRLL